MSRLIRAARRIPGALVDAKAQGEALLQMAEADAARIRSSAEDRIEEAKTLARAEALGQAEREAAALLIRATRAADRTLSASREAVATLAISVAREILGNELQSSADQVRAWVETALGRAQHANALQVEMNPQDLADLQRSEPGRALLARADTAWRPAPSLARGDCRVQTPSGAFNAGIEVQLARYLAALRSATEALDVEQPAS